MSLHPLDPEIVAQTDEWFYTSHPRGQELRGPDGDVPLDATSAEDAEGRRAWVEEYRRRLAEKQADVDSDEDDENDVPDSEVDDPLDPFSPCIGCCPTDFVYTVGPITIREEESTTLTAQDLSPLPGFGLGSYTWTTTGGGLTLEGAVGPLQTLEGETVTVLADQELNAPLTGEVVEVTRTQPNCAPITRQTTIFIKKCKLFHLAQPKIVAIATDGYLTPISSNSTRDPLLPGGHILDFGADLNHGSGRGQPHGVSVGTTTALLISKMDKLLSIFASGDTAGKARRLFNDFQRPQSAVGFWSDNALTSAAQVHPNIRSFVRNALAAHRTTGSIRIHQALRNASWDINSIVPPKDLGVPAFNEGSKVFSTEDFDNGLGLMINGIQHVIVVAKDYHYNRCDKEYYIKLEYVFYDVFGLDDEDLEEFGADGGYDTDASEGITAWWQLQHQHNYAPLITRIAFEEEFTIPAK